MPFDKKTKKISVRKGFSIMEVLFSVFVLEVGLVATVSLMASSISHSADSRNQIIAAQLAQEGIELINNIRDNNWANGSDAFFPPFPSNGDCAINYDEASCVAAADYKLYYKNNFYVHDSSESVATRFRRKIIIVEDPMDAANRRIKSIVIWGSAWPVADLSNCNTANKCTYSETVLSSINYH